MPAQKLEPFDRLLTLLEQYLAENFVTVPGGTNFKGIEGFSLSETRQTLKAQT